MARIAEVDVTPVRVPLDRPMGAAGRTFRFRDYLLVTVRCDDGSLGIGFSYVDTGGGRAAAMATEELLVPRHPRAPGGQRFERPLRRGLPG